MSAVDQVQVPEVRLSVLERIPWRRVVLIVLAVTIVATAGLGVIRTLSLPAGQRYSASAWRDFVVLGLAQGAIYALIALGYSLVYGILRMINFAHGEVFMFGAFVSYFFARAYQASGLLERQPLLALGIVFLVAIATSVLVALALERIAYRPLRGAPRLVPLITAIGASLFLREAARGFFGPQTRGFPKPSFLEGRWEILGFTFPRIRRAVMETPTRPLAPWPTCPTGGCILRSPFGSSSARSKWACCGGSTRPARSRCAPA